MKSKPDGWFSCGIRLYQQGSGWSQCHDCKQPLGPWWPSIEEAGQHRRECVRPPIQPRNLVAELKAPEPEAEGPLTPAPSVPGFACGTCEQLSYSAPGGQEFDTRPHAYCRQFGTVLLQTRRLAGCGGQSWNYIDDIVATELPPDCPAFS